MSLSPNVSNTERKENGVKIELSGMQADAKEDIESQPPIAEQKLAAPATSGKPAGMSDTALLAYHYKVVPNVFSDQVPPDQRMRPTNKRKSTRYTWVTFFPITFALQFKKFVNIFYLVTGFLNIFDIFRVNEPIIIIGTTVLIMLIGVWKEFVGEYKRWKDDKLVNAQPVQRLALPSSSSNQELIWEQTTLAQLCVGDIIQMYDREQIPADCVLLQVQDKKSEAFVSTAALDGERNLKPKLTDQRISDNLEALIGPKLDKSKAQLTVNCIPPQKSLYTFNGKLRAFVSGEDIFQDLKLDQFLHRGSYIENSGSVIALVVYTGVETKLIQNLGRYEYKMSTFEKMLNRIMVINLIAALAIAFTTAALALVWNNSHEKHDYIWYDFDRGEFFSYVIYLMRVYLIVNSFVPLDLLAMLQISQLVFTGVMQNDADMAYQDHVIRDVVQFKASTTNLAEELAQVDYIFCDKTGTLTQNELVFRAITLQQGQELRFKSLDEIRQMALAFDSLGLSGPETATVWNLFRCLNLCHDCITLKTEDKKGEKVTYNGPSVDEVCLLEMCADSGMGKFETRDASNYDVTINGQAEKWQLLKVFEFTSERKAMSAVFMHPQKPNTAVCFVKGADSSIFPLCKGYITEKSTQLLDNDSYSHLKAVEKSVETMAKKGLRTLLYGMKEIEWDGSRDVYDLELEEVESDLELLAATGVEDLLQERVKECIVDFREAGISVWMLTGDKGLTALEIGVSCGLIPSNRIDMRTDDAEQPLPTVPNVLDTETGAIEGNNDAKATKVLMFADLEKLEENTNKTYGPKLHEEIKKFLQQVHNQKGYCVLISGVVIAVALANSFTHPDLGKLLKDASSVVVYRSSPAQKAEVVTFMKRFTGGKVTLAIGDGANDVNMIQSADIGFGLMGKEGNQAAAFADYAIVKYKDLRRALFWHGRGYGWRIQYFTLLVLSKSIVNAVAKFGIQFYSGASGNQPVDDFLILGFNILMTNWFVLFYSIYDQDVSFKDHGTIENEASLPFTLASLYAHTRKFVNRKNFLKLVGIQNVYSLVAGLWIWAVWHFCDAEYIFKKDGQTFGLYTYGVFLTMSVVVSHHVMVVLVTRNWGLYLVFWACLSISLCPFNLWIAQIFKRSYTWHSTYSIILRHPTIWMMVFVTAFAIILPLLFIKRWLQNVRYPEFYAA